MYPIYRIKAHFSYMKNMNWEVQVKRSFLSGWTTHGGSHQTSHRAAQVLKDGIDSGEI